MVDKIFSFINSIGIVNTIILLFAIAGFVWLIAAAIVFVVRASNLEKVGLGGIEFEQDEKPKRRRRRTSKSI